MIKRIAAIGLLLALAGTALADSDAPRKGSLTASMGMGWWSSDKGNPALLITGSMGLTGAWRLEAGAFGYGDKPWIFRLLNVRPIGGSMFLSLGAGMIVDFGLLAANDLSAINNTLSLAVESKTIGPVRIFLSFDIPLVSTMFTDLFFYDPMVPEGTALAAFGATMNL
jgi:hypothetical protein